MYACACESVETVPWVGSWLSQNTLRSWAKLILSGWKTTLTTSAWPVFPAKYNICERLSQTETETETKTETAGVTDLLYQFTQQAKAFIKMGHDDQHGLNNCLSENLKEWKTAKWGVSSCLFYISTFLCVFLIIHLTLCLTCVRDFKVAACVLYLTGNTANYCDCMLVIVTFEQSNKIPQDILVYPAHVLDFAISLLLYVSSMTKWIWCAFISEITLFVWFQGILESNDSLNATLL